MAVTNEKSPQVNAIDVAGAAPLGPGDIGKLYGYYGGFTQGAAAGDATSTMDLLYLPAGKYRIIGRNSYIRFSAFGASRTLDVGYVAHTDHAGATVNADLDNFIDGTDVSSAGSAAFLADTLIDTRVPLKVQASVAGGTIPAAATIGCMIEILKVA